VLHTSFRPPAPHSDSDRRISVTALPDPRPGFAAVEVVGEVDAYTAPVLDACLRSQTRRAGLRELVVHLGGVTFLGAAGVRVLVQADRRCRTRRIRLALRTGGHRAVLRPLELTGAAELVAVDPAAEAGTANRGTRTRRRRRISPRRSAGHLRRVCR
jgi:anti-anti-sigma factor